MTTTKRTTKPKAKAAATKKAATQPKAKTWPGWQPMGGMGFGGTDFYGRGEPTATDLITNFNDVVYACATLIADTVASTPIKLYVKTDQGQQRPKCRTSPVAYKTLNELRSRKTLARSTTVEEVVEHPAIELLRKANSHHGYHYLAWMTQAYKETAGDAFWLMKKDPFGLPAEVYVLNPARMVPVRNDLGFICGWKYATYDGEVDYSVDDIVHFKCANLQDPYGMGYSPLRAIWDRVQISFKELGYLDATLSNCGRPDAVLSPDQAISPPEAERLAKEYTQRFRGAGNGGIFIADGPMKLTPLNYPPRDMAELQIYQNLKNAISNAYHIPPDIWELGNANRSTADAVLYALAVHCIRPRMCQFVETLNEKLVPLFDNRLFFEATEIVPEDRQFLKDERDMLLKNGVITRDEARVRYGFDEAEWAAEPLLPPGSQPLYMAQATMEANLTQPEQPTTVDRSAQAPALLALQQAVGTGQVSPDAARANATILYGFSPEEAAALFPDKPAPAQAEQQSGDDQGSEPDPVTAEQADAAAAPANDLRATVGGSVAVADLQRSYYRRELPREAAIANAVLIFGFSESEAATLFPELAPNALLAAQPQEAPQQPQQGEDKPEADAQPDPKAAKARRRLKAGKPMAKRNPMPLAEALQKFFKRQAGEVVGKVKAMQGAETKADGPRWFDLEAWTTEMFNDMRPVVQLYWDHGAKQTVSRIGGSLDLLKVVQPNLKEGIDKATMLFCRETNETTSLQLEAATGKLRESLAEGLTSGEVQNELMKRVQGVFEQAEVSRAYRIAVTEASRAQHAAMEVTAQASGIVKGKRWILSSDACPLCLPLSGKVVALGDNFTQDGTGPYSDIPYPPRHPNCRCDMIEVIEGVND